MRAHGQGSFALVSYVPAPLGSFLDDVRNSLPGSEPAQAHVTILPPRVLRIPLPEASDAVIRELNRFGPFEVELGEVRRFPRTNVLYLELTAGSSVVRELHDALNAGSLADTEQFEFQPHLTLGGPVPDSALAAAEAQAIQAWRSSQLPRRFRVDEVVALWSNPDVETPDAWSRIWAYDLAELRVRYPNSVATGQTS